MSISSINHSMLSIVFLLISFNSYGQEYQVSPDSPMKYELTYHDKEAQSFDLRNHKGTVEIYEAAGDHMSVEASIEKGQGSALVVVELASDGLQKIYVDYGTTSTKTTQTQKSDTIVQKAIVKGPGAAAINVEEGATVRINIGGGKGPSQVHIQGGGRVNMNIGGQNLEYNGETKSAPKTKTTEVHLKVGLPVNLMANLTVMSRSGDIDLNGQFDNKFQTNREVSLSSDSGEVSCVGLCSNGKLNVTSLEGMVFMQRVNAQSIFANTLDGSIFSSKSRGSLFATSDSGEIIIENHKAGVLSTITDSGNIQISQPEQGVTIGKVKSRHGGSIEIEEPPREPKTNNLASTQKTGGRRLRCAIVFAK